jgi:NAD(P)H-quinone oxidoreductase subunit 5
MPKIASEFGSDPKKMPFDFTDVVISFAPRPFLVIAGLLILFAAAGKSALVPFSNWLPRAMEGPTPSSAVFYGALSVHLGAFLLLRISPMFESVWELRAAVLAVGIITAIYGSLAARVQTDVKCALSFASLTQVGIIVVEIGLGWRYLAIIHMLGHGCWRTLQFLRAPTVLHDFRVLENAVGRRLTHGDTLWERVPQLTQRWLYRLALERGYWDSLLVDYVAQPLLNLLKRIDDAERAFTNWLAGPETGDPRKDSLDDLA